MIRTFATKAEGKQFPTIRSVTQLLDSALDLVPKLGWTDALTEATRAHGLSDQAAAIFPRGACDVVLHHHSRQLAELRNVPLEGVAVGVPRVQKLLEHRLVIGNGVSLGAGTANIASSARQNLREAVGMLLRPTNAPAAAASLGELVDEVWWLAGDRSTDTTWYSRRASLAALYASVEAFQSRDASPNSAATVSFMRRALDRWASLEYAESSMMEWLAFNGRAAFNIARTYLN